LPANACRRLSGRAISGSKSLQAMRRLSASGPMGHLQNHLDPFAEFVENIRPEQMPLTKLARSARGKGILIIREVLFMA
jgi:hypothetical protein